MRGDADIDDLDEGGLPFDDPVARTRMAWLRTMLIVAVIGLLMWRSAYIEAQEWWSLAWMIPSLVVIGIAIGRMRVLARDGTGESRVMPMALTTGGFLVLVAVGMALALV